jgi:predicted AAA+ superfamily ATPase
MVCGGHVSSVSEAESAKMERNRDLAYSCLGKLAVELVVVECLLKKFDDVVVMNIRKGLESKGVDGASEMENSGSDAEANQ